MERDYQGVSDEIIRCENEYRDLREDKVASESKGRITLDQDYEEVAMLRKQAEELKRLLAEKDQSNYELQDELQRSKRVLDDQMVESGRLRDQVVSETARLNDLKAQVSDLERDISGEESHIKLLKSEKEELLNIKAQLSNTVSKQQISYGELDREIVRTLESSKITDQIIRDRDDAIKQKQGEYDATKRELTSLTKDIVELAEEVQALKNDINVIRNDNIELKQIIDDTIEKNQDLLAYKDKLDQKIGDNEFNIDRTLRDIEVLKLDEKDLRVDYDALILEKEALERHAKILINQNDELTRELEMFVQTDEVLRSQLDRKARLNDLSYRNAQDNERVRAKIEYARSISRSRSPVYERSRSPVYERSRSPPVYERVAYDKKYTGGSLRSPTRGDLKTTAATKKYGADFEEDYQPVSSFKYSANNTGYASRFQTQAKKERIDERKASPLRSVSSSAERARGFRSEYKPQLGTFGRSEYTRPASKYLDQKFERISVYDRKGQSPLRGRSQSPKQEAEDN